MTKADDGRIACGKHRLSVAEIDGLYAVAIAQELRGFRDLPRCRPSQRTSFECSWGLAINSATATRLEAKGLIAIPIRRVYGESSDYGRFPLLTEEGRAALATRYEIGVMTRVKAIREAEAAR